VIEQTPTKIYLPNNEATREDFIDGFGLTVREFKLIKEQLEPGSRSFLVKQGRHSVVCQLDLKGFSRELAVISGRSTTVEIMNRIVSEHGSVPKEWLPPFYEAALAPVPKSPNTNSITPSKGAP
jgi:type IV secretion system protein VirB4